MGGGGGGDAGVEHTLLCESGRGTRYHVDHLIQLYYYY
jgi:hypothetical protein